MRLFANAFKRLLWLCLLSAGWGFFTPTAGADSPLKRDDRVQVRLIGENFYRLKGFVGALANDTLRIITKGDVRIEGITTTSNLSFDFPLTGGVYDGERKEVRGITDAGDSVIFSISDIADARVTLFQSYKPVQATFSAHQLDTRLRHGIRYPRLEWYGPVDSIRTLKVWRKGNTAGIFLSALVGLVVGVSWGLTAEDDLPDPDCWVYCYEVSKETKLMVRSAVGLAVGAGAGYLIFKSRWYHISVDRLREHAGADYSHGVGLNLAVKW